jgi:hypothetical protein
MLVAPQTISTNTREGRLLALNSPHMVPTIKLTAYDCCYFFDLDEVTVAGLVQVGALASEPGTAPGGRPSPRVDLVAAARGWMLLNHGRVHYGWEAGLIERIKDRRADSQNLINRLGCFAVAAAFSRSDWQFTLRALPDFIAAHHDIDYGVAIDEIRQYAAGKCPA